MSCLENSSLKVTNGKIYKVFEGNESKETFLDSSFTNLEVIHYTLFKRLTRESDLNGEVYCICPLNPQFKLLRISDSNSGVGGFLMPRADTPTIVEHVIADLCMSCICGQSSRILNI